MTEILEENVVLEGFLCPICKVDFGLDLKLYLHFQEAHGEDQDLVKSFKGIVPSKNMFLIKCVYNCTIKYSKLFIYFHRFIWQS